MLKIGYNNLLFRSYRWWFWRKNGYTYERAIATWRPGSLYDPRPTNLCPFVRRAVLYAAVRFFFQGNMTENNLPKGIFTVPLVYTLLMVLGIAFISNPIGGLLVIGGFMVLCLILFSIVFVGVWIDEGGAQRLKRKFSSGDNSDSALGTLAEFVDAKHNRICPMIEVDDPKDVAE